MAHCFGFPNMKPIVASATRGSAEWVKSRSTSQYEDCSMSREAELNICENKVDANVKSGYHSIAGASRKSAWFVPTE